MYRLYIDETGNADLQASKDPNHRFLSLSGIIIELDHARDVAFPRLEAIKHDVLRSHPDEPIVLHRKDIIARNYPFHPLRDEGTEAEFNRRLLGFLRDTEYTVISAVIDKADHLTRYAVWRQDPYHYCLEVLVERYVMWLKGRGAKGDVMAEVRGGKPDRRLENAFAYFYSHGTGNVTAAQFQRHITSKKLKLKRKEANVTGLQIADLVAQPSSMYIRSQNGCGDCPDRFGGEIVQLLTKAKYRRSGNGKIVGWGTKWLP